MSTGSRVAHRVEMGITTDLPAGTQGLMKIVLYRVR
jgi:hypothetical protein